MARSEALKRVTAADVARALGISRTTVSFVLNNTPGQTIPAATRERVITEAKRLGYRPHMAARTLRSGQSRIVLLILPDWPMDYSMRTHLDEASLVLVEEIASTIAFMVSDECSFTTGFTFDISGGRATY